MAGGGARRGTLVHPLWDRSPTSAPRPRQPRDGTGSCGSQPAYQSLLDRRLQRRPRPCATLSQVLAAELIGRRTLMSHALEKGHESGQTQTDGTDLPSALARNAHCQRVHLRYQLSAPHPLVKGSPTKLTLEAHQGGVAASRRGVDADHLLRHQPIQVVAAILVFGDQWHDHPLTIREAPLQGSSVTRGPSPR